VSDVVAAEPVDACVGTVLRISGVVEGIEPSEVEVGISATVLSVPVVELRSEEVKDCARSAVLVTSVSVPKSELVSTELSWRIMSLG